MNPTFPLLVEKPIKIYAYDIDAMGVVSNIVYIRWFEDLRTLFLDTYWPYEEMLLQHQSPVLAKTEVQYKYPLTLHEKPMGRTWVQHFGRAKWEMAFEISDETRTYCKGTQMGYVVDIRNKKPIPIPEGLLTQYKAAYP